MTIKAVFFDIDGTYFDHVGNRVLPQSRQAVKELKKNGYKVALCSGRALSMARTVPVFDDIEWDGFIGCGGNFVYDKNFQCIYKNPIDTNQLKQAFALAKKNDLALFVTGEELYTTRPLYDREQAILDIFHLNAPENTHEWQGEDVHMISMLGGVEFDYSEFHAIEGLFLQPSCSQIMDILAPNMNKAKGIAVLLDHLGIEQGAYLAFGDNINDAEMLEAAEIGVAMGNSIPALHPFANRICASSHEPGIAQTLVELGLITSFSQ